MKSYEIKEENIEFKYLSDELLPETVVIDIAIKEDGDYKKFLTLQKDMDIKISYFDFENDNDIINLYIDKENIICPILDKFLSNDEKVRINSDDKRRKNIKYLDIKRRKEYIVINFVNNDSDVIDKHNIFIKNILFDLRSKVENNDLKDRLLELFSDFKLLFEEKNKRDKIMEYKIN